MWYNQRRVRHDSAAQIFNVLYRKAPANLGVGTVYLRRCRPSYSDERIARHGYPPGDLLLPFGQFTLCRACEDKTACVAVRCLTLRIGGDMGALRAPLRQKKSSAVPLFRSGRRSLVCTRLGNKGKREFQEGRNRRCLPFWFPRRNRRRSLAAGAAIGYISPPTYNRSRGPLQYGSGPPANPQF